MTTNQNNLEEKPMTFIDHLRDLRDCIVRAAISIVIGMCLAFGFSEHIFDIIRKPIVPYLQGGGLVFTSPIDKFMAHLQISLVMGLILSAPFWLYQVWKFISPALYKNEKKIAASFVITGTIQFLLGAAFCYYIVFPGAFEFLMKFGGTTDKPMITISQYLDFFTHTIIIFGLTFEVPVIIVFLGMIGLISQRFLKEKRRYSILVNAIIAGIVTPPDLLSMLFLLVPLMVMYEISIILVGIFERRKAAEANKIG
jgi:sec-independent protein translocase protein TatC